jgi:hypothetical protein
MCSWQLKCRHVQEIKPLALYSIGELIQIVKQRIPHEQNGAAIKTSVNTKRGAPP